MIPATMHAAKGMFVHTPNPRLFRNVPVNPLTKNGRLILNSLVKIDGGTVQKTQHATMSVLRNQETPSLHKSKSTAKLNVSTEHQNDPLDRIPEFKFGESEFDYKRLNKDHPLYGPNDNPGKIEAKYPVVGDVKKLDKPKHDMLPTRGKQVIMQLDGKEQVLTVEGHDYQGRPKVIDENGNERIITDVKQFDRFVARDQNTVYHYLEVGNAHYANQKMETAIQLALNRPIVAGITAQDYFDALEEKGHRPYLLGGAVRDLIQAMEKNPLISPEQLSQSFMDIDVSVPGIYSTGEKIFKEIHAKDEGVVIAGWKEYGGCHVKDSSGGEGFDYNSMMVGNGTYSSNIVHPDIADEGPLPPATFDHDPEANTLALDFCCNTLNYDTVNNVIIDPTGHGIQDAQNKFLRLTGGENLKKNYSITLACKQPEMYMRFWKFRMRDYTSNSFTTKIFLKQAKKLWKSMPEEKLAAQVGAMLPLKALKAFAGDEQKMRSEAKSMLKKLEKVIAEDCQVAGLLPQEHDVYKLILKDKEEKLIEYIVNRVKPMKV